MLRYVHILIIFLSFNDCLCYQNHINILFVLMEIRHSIIFIQNELRIYINYENDVKLADNSETFVDNYSVKLNTAMIISITKYL